MKPKHTGFRASRRAFLGGLAGITASLPLVPLLEAGQDPKAGYPTRLLLVHTPDGAFTDNWRPTGGEYDFVLSPILSPLEDMRQHIVVCDGLRATVGGAGEAHAYGMGGLWSASSVLSGNLFDGGNGNLTGWGSGPSIDQLVADLFAKETAYRSLEFGVQTGDPNIVSRMIYAGPEAPIHPEPSPYAMFDKLFADIGATAEELAQLRARKQSIIDGVRGQLTSLEPRVAMHDKVKIEAHLDAIRAIEERLDADFSGCSIPVMGAEIDIGSNESFPLVGDLQMRLCAAALACDVTRVASLQWSRGFSGIRHDWVGYGTQGHHSYSHDENATLSEEADTAIDTWYAQRFRDLLLYLQSYPEGDGTLLDHTIVVWGREIGFPRGHNMHPMPFVVAGGGGQIATGRYLDFGDQPHVKFLVSLCRAMGLTDMQSLGNIAQDSGPLVGL